MTNAATTFVLGIFVGFAFALLTQNVNPNKRGGVWAVVIAAIVIMSCTIWAVNLI